VERLLFALVAKRALEPSSKLAIAEWVAEEVAVPGLESVAVQPLDRAMDVLLRAEAELQHRVYTAVADVLSLEVDLLFFDMERVLGRAGRSKQIATGVEFKEVVVGDGEARRRYLLVRNPHEAERDRAHREATLTELRERLAALKAATGTTHSKLQCALSTDATFGRWLV